MVPGEPKETVADETENTVSDGEVAEHEAVSSGAKDPDGDEVFEKQ